jgi:hypothetical protein
MGHLSTIAHILVPLLGKPSLSFRFPNEGFNLNPCPIAPGFLGSPLAIRKATAALLRQAADKIEAAQPIPVGEWVNAGRSKLARWVMPDPQAFVIPRKES